MTGGVRSDSTPCTLFDAHDCLVVDKPRFTAAAYDAEAYSSALTEREGQLSVAAQYLEDRGVPIDLAVTSSAYEVFCSKLAIILLYAVLIF